jgi:hypothetical protein
MGKIHSRPDPAGAGLGRRVGHPYYRAETALQVLELIQDPGGPARSH